MREGARECGREGGSAARWVKVMARREPGHIVIMVEDQGPGVPEELREKMSVIETKARKRWEANFA